jgi:hypothetical protein
MGSLQARGVRIALITLVSFVWATNLTRQKIKWWGVGLRWPSFNHFTP